MNLSSVALYTQAQQAIASGHADDRDRVIVEMWALNRASVEEIMRLRLQVQSLASQLDSANRQIAESQFMTLMGNAMSKDTEAVVQ